MRRPARRLPSHGPPTAPAERGCLPARRTAHLRERAAGRYVPSGTAGDTDEVRTSSSLWLSHDDMAGATTTAISQRMAQTLSTIVKASNELDNPQLHVFPANWRYAEVFQMARYDEGQYYAAHSDFTVEPGYDRVATFLIYLSDAHDGGETVFPYLRATTDASKAAEGQVTYVWNKQPDYRAMTCDSRNETRCGAGGPGEGYDAKGLQYCCCTELLRLSPREGDAVLFFPAKADGSKEKIAVHASCKPRDHSWPLGCILPRVPAIIVRTGPVIYGDQEGQRQPKELVQQWFHAEPLERSGALHPAHARKGGRRKHRTRKKQRKVWHTKYEQDDVAEAPAGEPPGNG